MKKTYLAFLALAVLIVIGLTVNFGLTSYNVDPPFTPSMLPVTLDVADNMVGVNKINPTMALDVVGDVGFTGSLLGTSTDSIGWTVQTAANQACNTTCTNACVVGFNTGILALALPHIVACTDNTGDECLCAGPN